MGILFAADGFETVEKDDGQYDTVMPVFWVSGAAFFVRLKDYREAGGLDGAFLCSHGGN